MDSLRPKNNLRQTPRPLHVPAPSVQPPIWLPEPEQSMHPQAPQNEPPAAPAEAPSLPPFVPPSAPKKPLPPLPSDAPHRAKGLKHPYRAFFLAVFCLFFFGTSFLFFKGLAATERIHITGSTEAAPTLTEKIKTLRGALLPGERTVLRGEADGRINVLLLGKAGEEAATAKDLTDTIMLASIDTKTKRVALLSLPRDLYYTDSKLGLSGKLNSLYQQSLAKDKDLHSLGDAITTITGQPVHYFFVIDFAGFEQVVDAVGGVSVDVPKDFYDPRYPGKNFSYETFELQKGWQKLDGATTLKYVRERHDDPEGDFGRAKRQQQVLQAIKNKVFSPGTYFNFLRITKLLESVDGNVTTNANLDEMRSFYDLSQTVDTQNITNVVVDAFNDDSLLRVTHQNLGGVRAFTLTPRTGNFQEVHDLAGNIFELTALKDRKAKIASEGASVAILDDGESMQSANKLKSYLERELGMQATVVYDNHLDQSTNGGMLLTRSGLQKPYSFDELLKRLPVQKSTRDIALPPEALSSDFIITMNSSLSDTFASLDAFFNQSTDENQDTPLP